MTLSLKGGAVPLGDICPYPSTNVLIHHHGDIPLLLPCYAAQGFIPTFQGLVPTLFAADWRVVVVGVVSMRGLGHWLGVGGSVGLLWGVSGPFPAFVL